VPASKKTPTRDKSDPNDAVLIGRLVAGLRCYLPERTDQIWARLRQLGARRTQLTTQVGTARQQLRDLLECAWPAVLEATAEPLDSRTWRAAVQVALARTAGDPATLGRLGQARFARAVTRELARWGAKRRCLRIVRAVGAAATTPRRCSLAWTPSGQAPWNAPASPWTTGTMPSASSPRPSSA
jgi:transposase